MNLPQRPYFKHAGVFSFLFLLSILYPAGFHPSLNVPVSPLVLVLLGCTVLITAWRTHTIRSFWQQNRGIISASSIWFMLSAISLYLNIDSYPDRATFLRWGVIFVIFPLAIPLAIMLAQMPDKKHFNKHQLASLIPTLPVVIALFLPLMAVWQAIDFQSYAYVAQFLLAAAEMDPINIRGVFPISTDLGAISGILFITSTVLLTQTPRHQRKTILILSLISGLNACAGLMSGARIFILMSLLGAIALTFQLFRHRKQVLFALTGLGAMCLTAIFQFIPLHTAAKLSQSYPAVIHFKLGIPVALRDLLPNFSASALGDREPIWTRAMEQMMEHPFTGISNGAFRLLGEQEGETRINNAHNAFLQAGVDAGIFGFILVLALAFWLLVKTRHRVMFPVVVAIVGSLCVDNFTDHSFPWILIACSIACLSPLYQTVDLNVSERLAVKPVVALAGIVGALSIMNYLNTVSHFKHMPLSQQANQAFTLSSGSASETSPVFVTPTLFNALKTDHSDSIFIRWPTLNNQHLCNYIYPKSSILSDTPVNSPAVFNTELSSALYLAKPTIHDCQLTLDNPLHIQHWTSNLGEYVSQHLVKQSSGTALRLMYDGVAVWSPRFMLNNKSFIQLTANGIAVSGQYPELMITIYDGDTGKKLKDFRQIIHEQNTELKLDISDYNVQRGFIKLRLLNYKYNSNEHQYQIVYIKNAGLH